MDKQQTARWKRQLKLKQVRQDFAATPVSGLVSRAFARHDALLATADDLMTSPAGRSTGATLKKSTEEKRVVTLVLPVANALYLLYLEAEDEEKAHALRLLKSDYNSLPGTLLLAEARNVAKQARANAKALADEADIDKADLDELDAAIGAFDKLMTAPKVSIENGKNTNTALDAALRAADKYVKEKLTPTVELLSRKQPKFYEALRTAMRIDDAPGARGSGDAAPPAPGKPTGPAA